MPPKALLNLGVKLILVVQMASYKLKLTKKDLPEDTVAGEEVAGVMLAIIMHQGKVYAMTAKCSHEGGPLQDGSIDGDDLICPWHSAAYNIMTGQVSENTPWAPESMKPYPVQVNEQTGELSIEM
jgi:nitrite reductase/ring-hydroxylating ferredoxin subunit